MRVHKLSMLTLAAVLLVMSGKPAPAQEAQGLNLQEADLRAFIQDVSRATGTTFIVDPRVQGTVTVSRDRAMSESEMLGVLLAVLRANGLVAVPTGAGAYRVVPDDTAAQQPGTYGGSAMGFATEVFALRHIDARIAAETLRPLVGRGGVVLATPQGNSVLVADYADNLRRLRGLVAQIDQDRASIDTVTLRNSSAREMATTINSLFGARGADTASAVLSVLPVESSNSVVVRGDPTLVQRVVQTVLELDRRAERSGDVRVVKLQHANAEQLLPVLQELIGQAPGAANGDASQAAASASPASKDTQVIGPPGGKRPVIARYPGANALIINADPETQRLLTDVITRLDTRREQVLVEAIVVEISDDAARELGVQLLIAGREGSDVPFMATQYPSASPGILPLAAGVIAAQRGRGSSDADNDALDLAGRTALQSLLGLNGGLAGFGGSRGDALFGLIINAVKSDTSSNLLSTPSIMTLDNEEARILVGQEVPITTGEVLGDANTNPFRTTARQDVGIQLEVKPQINTGGGITLFLRQEVSSIAGPVTTGSSDLILNKRELETKVLVDDGAIVALGGLLDQNDRQTVDKIPLLGDIPVVGGLFRNTARARAKTNLMVFIRPTIVRGTQDAQRIAGPRYDYMRDSQVRDPGEQAMLDALVRDYLRTVPPVAPPPGTTVPGPTAPATPPATATPATPAAGPARAPNPVR